MSPARPLVTIGMPVRNGGRTLARALDSLTAQTYGQIEILISNNASTDDTGAVADAYAAHDSRVRPMHQASSLGIVENFMAALDAARGEYFMWAADDDVWLPEFVEVLAAELDAHSDASVAMSAVDLVSVDGRPIQTIRFSGRYDPNTSSHLRLLQGATTLGKLNFYIYGLYRTAFLRRAMQTFADVPGLDRVFVCQLALATRFRYVDRVLHQRTVHERPTHARLPDERFNAMKRDPMSDVKVLVGLARSVSGSEVVPWTRKLLLPYALWRYARFLMILRAGAFAKRHLPAPLWTRLRNRTP